MVVTTEPARMLPQTRANGRPSHQPDVSGTPPRRDRAPRSQSDHSNVDGGPPTVHAGEDARQTGRKPEASAQEKHEAEQCTHASRSRPRHEPVVRRSSRLRASYSRQTRSINPRGTAHLDLLVPSNPTSPLCQPFLGLRRKKQSTDADSYLRARRPT